MHLLTLKLKRHNNTSILTMVFEQIIKINSILEF